MGLQGEMTTKTHVKSEVGRRNGLRLTLDLHSNLVSFGTLDQDYEAFNVLIGQPAEFPMMKERGLQVESGREHFIDLSAVVVSTNDIKDLTPEARDCFFADEGNLDFYERYTFSNCKLECAIKKSEEIFKCVPWYLPKGETSSTCNPWTARDFTAHMGEATKDCSQCRSDCQLTTYSTTVTSSAFRLCDSRNLNLSPFCNLSESSLAKWRPAINSTYGEDTTNYTNGVPGPLRLKYPKISWTEQELLVSLTQVSIQNAFIDHYPLQGDAYYNAYEKDIAVVNIFFGGSTVFEF